MWCYNMKLTICATLKIDNSIEHIHIYLETLIYLNTLTINTIVLTLHSSACELSIPIDEKNDANNLQRKTDQYSKRTIHSIRMQKHQSIKRFLMVWCSQLFSTSYNRTYSFRGDVAFVLNET